MSRSRKRDATIAFVIVAAATVAAWRFLVSRREVIPEVNLQGAPLAFVGVRIFDGQSMIPDQTVVVAGEKIFVVGHATEVAVPQGARVIEGSGKTLLPGFIDSHVHIGFFDPKTVLAGGITTARDLAWPPDRILPLADRLESDLLAGPRLLVAGPMLTAPGGYPTKASWAPPGTGREVGDVTETRAAVKEFVALGADVIKVAQEPREGPVMSPEVLIAIVEEAHAAGLKVTSHLGSLDQLGIALDAGVDELAHGLWSNEEIPDDLIRRMVAAGMTVVPTLHIDPSAQRIENLRRFVAAGGRVIYGTDMGNTGPPPGIDPEELRLMVEAGMSPLDALAAATSRAADYLGLTDKGRIGGGKDADLVLVEGDPVADLKVLAAPSMVLRGGRIGR